MRRLVCLCAAAELLAASAAADVSISLKPGGVRALYLPGEVPEIAVCAANGADSAVDVSVDFRMTDYFGVAVWTNSDVISVGPRSEASRRLSFPELSKLGFYCLTAKWSGGGSAGEAEGSFVRTGPLPDPPDPLFGISGFAPVEPETYSRMGVGTKALSLNWRSLEGKDGRLSFDKALDEIRSLRAKGIRVVGHTFVPPRPTTTPRRYLKKKYGSKEDPIADPAGFLADFEEFVFSMVTALKGEIGEWAAVNEINLSANSTQYMRQRYIDCIRAMSRGMRRADPGARLLGLGCSGADGRAKPRYPFLRGMLPSIVDCIDGFCIDQYTAGQKYGIDFANLDSEQAELRDIMLEAVRIAKKNGKRIVTIDEKGPSIARSTPISAPCGRLMADIVARDFIILKTIPEVGHWLYFRPFNWNDKSVVDWGMWERDNPRQVVSAYSATARMMAGARFIRGVPVQKDIPCWLFRRGDTPFAALWYNGPEPLEFRLAAGVGVSARDVQGNELLMTNRVVTLSSTPVYLFASDEGGLERAIAGAAFDVPDMEAVMDVADFGRRVLAVRNVGPSPIDVTVDGHREASVSLRPDETKSVFVRLRDGERSVALKSSSGRTISVATPEAPRRVRRVGGFADLSEVDEIRLDDPMRFAPGYADLKANGLYAGPDDLSVAARLGYDDSRFYLEFVVRDDAHMNDNMPARVFAGDCVQYAFDTLRNGRVQLLKGERGFADDDYNFVSGMADGEPVTKCYGAPAAVAERLCGVGVGAPEIVRREEEGTTRYRIAIPFADLAPLTPEKGRVFGFSFLAFDKDPGEGKLYRIEATEGIATPTNPSRLMAFVLD